MHSATNVRELMEKLHRTHRALRQSLNESAANGFRKTEPKEITARRAAFQSAFRQLFDDYLEPLDQRFRLGEKQAIDEVIEFLRIDVPAFICVYL